LCLENIKNRLKHAIQIAEYVGVRESEDPIAPRAQESGASCIARELFVCRMRRPINFDDRAMFPANEIGEIRSDKLLTHEFMAVKLSISQPSPQLSLGRSRVLPERTRAASFKEAKSAHG
jgi:hypothetical protein